MNRSNWSVDFSVYDKDGDFSGTEIWIDVDSGEGIQWIKGVATDTDGSGGVDAFVFEGMGRLNIDYIDDMPPGVLQDSINLGYDWIKAEIEARDSDWDGRSGEFNFRIVHELEQPNPLFALFQGHQEIVSEVTVIVGSDPGIPV